MPDLAALRDELAAVREENAALRAASLAAADAIRGLGGRVDVAEDRADDLEGIAARLTKAVDDSANPHNLTRETVRAHTRLDGHDRFLDAGLASPERPAWYERAGFAVVGVLRDVDSLKRLGRTLRWIAVLGLLYWLTFGRGLFDLMDRYFAHQLRLAEARGAAVEVVVPPDPRVGENSARIDSLSEAGPAPDAP